MGLGVTVGDKTLGVSTSVKVETGSGDVENTDQSYQDTVASGGTLVIPDINITKNDDSVVTSPAAIDLDLRIIDPSSIPATWAELVAEYGQGYPYAQVSGQTTSYRTGDDKSIEDSTFAAARVANKLKVFNTLASFLVLNNNNTFGNTNRFTDSVGGQDYDGTGGSLVAYIIDHFTGLGWLNQYEADKNWNDAIDFALAATNVTFSDWFMANNNQHHSIADFENAKVRNYAPFSIVSTRTLVSSTTYAPSTASAWTSQSGGILTITGKTSASPKLMLCRKHY